MSIPPTLWPRQRLDLNQNLPRSRHLHPQVAESTWHCWQAQYGGMKANDAKRLKELEARDARRKKLAVSQDIDVLKDSAGNF